MTDLNVTLTDVETGELKERFSVHRGTAYSLTSLLSRVRDAIRSEMDIDSFVPTAQENVAEYLSRIAVPGGWLYRHAGDRQMVYVPDARNEGSFLSATKHIIKVDVDR